MDASQPSPWNAPLGRKSRANSTAATQAPHSSEMAKFALSPNEAAFFSNTQIDIHDQPFDDVPSTPSRQGSNDSGYGPLPSRHTPQNTGTPTDLSPMHSRPPSMTNLTLKQGQGEVSPSSVRPSRPLTYGNPNKAPERLEPSNHASATANQVLTEGLQPSSDPFRTSPTKRNGHRQSLSTLPENPNESPALEFVGSPTNGGSSREYLFMGSERSRKITRIHDSEDDEAVGGVALSKSVPGRAHAQTFSAGQMRPNTHGNLYRNQHASITEGMAAMDIGVDSLKSSIVGNSKSASDLKRYNTFPTTYSASADEGTKTPSDCTVSKSASESVDESGVNATRAKQLAEMIKAGAFEEEHEDSVFTAGSGAICRPPVTNTSSHYAAGVRGKANETPMPTNMNVLPQYPVQVPGTNMGPVPYTPHVQAEYPPFSAEGTIDPVVQQFQAAGDLPGFEKMMEYLPFVNRMEMRGPSAAGVVKVTDIPYSTSRQEVVAFFGRNARLVQHPDRTPFYAIHIIMERSTAKSMDVFVEFESERDAALAVLRFQREPRRATTQGHARKPRMGDRTVKVELASQSELMQELFPRAKCVQWNGQDPTVFAPAEEWTSGFSGFVTPEELHSTVKYATNPSRSRFATKHVQRTYESMISLIHKYPWWRSELYTLEERNQIFRACNAMIDCLSHLLMKGENRGMSQVLTPQLLEELLCVGLTCPAFNEKQRFTLLNSSRFIVGRPRWVSPEFARRWPFEALARRDNTSEQLVRWYALKIRSQSDQALVENDEPSPKSSTRQHEENTFGSIGRFAANTDPKSTLMKMALDHEMSILQTVLSTCNTTGLFQPSVMSVQSQPQIQSFQQQFAPANQNPGMPIHLLQTMPTYQLPAVPGYQVPGAQGYSMQPDQNYGMHFVPSMGNMPTSYY